MKKKVLYLLLVCIFIISGCSNKNANSKWSDKYLDFVKNEYVMKDSKIMFYESELSKDPIMLIYNDTERDTETPSLATRFSTMFYKIEDDKVVNIAGVSTGSKTDLVFGYDIQKNNYNYFTRSGMEDSETYESLDSIIIDKMVGDELLEDGVSGTDSNRLEKEKEKLSKYDNYAKYFRVTDPKSTAYKDVIYVIDTKHKIDYISYKKDNKYLEKEFNKITKKYKKNKEIGKQYKELIEKETKKEKETNSDNKTETGKISAGDYSIQYGTYKSSISDVLGEYGGEYTIKEDGTFTYINNWKDNSGNSYTNKASGTYKVEYANMKEMDEMPDDYKWVITFTATSYSGKGRFEDSQIPNDKYYNVDSYDITDNNKFQASQYENVWTLVS